MLRLLVGFLFRIVKYLFHLFLERCFRLLHSFLVLFKKSLPLRRVAVHNLKEGLHEQFQLLRQLCVAVALGLPASICHLFLGLGNNPLSQIGERSLHVCIVLLHFLLAHVFMILLFLLQLAFPFLIICLTGILPFLILGLKSPFHFLKSALNLGFDDILAACTLQIKVVLNMPQPLRYTGELAAYIGEFLLQTDA